MILDPLLPAGQNMKPILSLLAASNAPQSAMIEVHPSKCYSGYSVLRSLE
jgi:hypothetical protein